VSCFADGLIVPNNDFFKSNREQCESHSRDYVGAPGTVTQESPYQPIPVFELEENRIYCVVFTYTDSEEVVWGCVSEEFDRKGNYGWVPMDALRPVYDVQAFYEEHEGEIISSDGFTPDFTKPAVVYNYPRSPRKWIMESRNLNKTTYFYEAWVDENGVTWLKAKDIYIADRFCIRGGWICLDNQLAGWDLACNSGNVEITPDPAAPEIEGLLPADHIIYLDDSTPSLHIPQTGKVIWIALAITLVAAGAAVGLAFALKKKK
ncbi:MAG: hypothetical protein II350_08475, partial [Clostridia bacterium]|nr:hypothetical protein [Clostridia bacterium]